MKQFFRLFLLVSMLLGAYTAQAVYVENMPVVQIQPNGDTLHFFVTGDECYHRFHDAQGYTIVQAPSGYWVYAQPDDDGGIKPSQYRVGEVSPAAIGLLPGLTITCQQWEERRKAWEIPEQYRLPERKDPARNRGDFCNLVIFMRFADDTIYTRPITSIDQMFSDSSTSTVTSVYNYFKRASYNQLFVHTYYAPEPDGTQILSYQSPHPRNYYMPYTESNQIGYTNYSDRTNREFELLIGAVNYINDSAPIPASYNLDCNGDGFVDNVNFVVKGAAAGWNDLLWPHKWNLYGREVYINGKQVSTFNLALEGSGPDYFGASTFCHEMFHSLGAPDLYRYNAGTDVSPVGEWDLMATNSKPPQHMSAYMKHKYGNWIDSIPLITTPGTYTLTAVGDSLPDGHALMFPSADTNQFYVVEYRNKNRVFESKLPGTGLIIYRVDKRFNGNAGYNGEDGFDEIWMFRPGSNNNRTTGQLSEAYFNPSRQRTEFSPSTTYYPHLTDGTPDMTFSISNVSVPGNTISFYYTNRTIPAHLQTTRITTTTTSLAWEGVGDAYRVSYRERGSGDEWETMLVRYNHATLLNLTPNTMYECRVRALYDRIGDNHYADSSQLSTTIVYHTESCNNATTATVGDGTSESRTGLPFVSNNNYNYSQQIFLANELDGGKTIDAISFHYAHTTALTKTNCTIYLANTTLSRFEEMDSAVPATELTQVFEGTLTLSQGWNEIVLDNEFYYNGVDNLLLAIDDNSGVPSRVGHKFYTHSTNDIMSLVYYSNNDNPDPYDDTVKGSLNRLRSRDNVRFSGCPDVSGYYYACIISDNENLGRVRGEGLYSPGETITIRAIATSGYEFFRWNDDNTDNPRYLTITQDTVLVAYFKSPLGIEPVSGKPGYVVTTRGLEVTVEGADGESVEAYDLMGRRVAYASNQQEHRLYMPRSGVYIIRINGRTPVKVMVW